MHFLSQMKAEHSDAEFAIKFFAMKRIFWSTVLTISTSSKDISLRWIVKKLDQILISEYVNDILDIV